MPSFIVAIKINDKIHSSKVNKRYYQFRFRHKDVSTGQHHKENEFQLEILTVDGLIFIANAIASIGLSPTDVSDTS
jgi:hypothetical protein